MKAITWILLLWLNTIFSQDAPKEVWAFIQEAMTGKYGLQEFDEIKKEIGFSSSTSLSDLTIGPPFKEY